MGNGGVVRIKRGSSEWRDRLRKYKVVLDGVVVAKLRNGEKSELAVPAGRHSLEIRIDWTGSDVAEFTVADGETVEFVCGATPCSRCTRPSSRPGMSDWYALRPPAPSAGSSSRRVRPTDV
jgi:hypothetical protein